MSESSYCSTSSSAFGVVNVLDFGHSYRCLLIVAYYSLMTSFHMFICYLYIFFGEGLWRPLAHFLNWVVFLLLGFKRQQSLLIYVFCKYFLQVCGFFFFHFLERIFFILRNTFHTKKYFIAGIFPVFQWKIIPLQELEPNSFK